MGYFPFPVVRNEFALVGESAIVLLGQAPTGAVGNVETSPDSNAVRLNHIRGVGVYVFFFGYVDHIGFRYSVAHTTFNHPWGGRLRLVLSL